MEQTNVESQGLHQKGSIPLRSWGIIILCGFAGALFHMDRQTLSVLKTTLKGEFGWNDTDYGWLVSVFMLVYTAAYFISGRWVDKWGSRKTMPALLIVMSIATIMSGLANSLHEMAIWRALLGVAEAGVMPTVMVAVFFWFPPERRGTANAIKEPIYVVGQIAATPMAALMTALISWHFAFFTPGVFGLFVAVAWWFTDCQKLPKSTVEIRDQTLEPKISYLDILRRKEIWGVILARLISDPLWFFFIYWEPGYLQEKVGLSLHELAQIGWIPTAAGTSALLLLSFFSDSLISRLNWSPAKSRRMVLQFVSVLSPMVLLLQFTDNRILVIALLCVARMMMVTWLGLSSLLMADIVPRKMIGTSIALMSAFGAGTGLLFNSFVGPVLGSMGYGVIFAFGAMLHPIASVVLWLWYGRNSGNH